MKKTTIILFFLMCTSFAYSQYRGYDEWIISIGVNILDNSASQDPIKGSESWSFSHPITLGVEYKWNEQFSINPMLSFNKVNEVYEDSAHGGAGWIEGGNYTSFDVNGKFYFDEYIAQNDNFDAYAGLGLGYFKVADESNGSGNFNLGMRYWFSPEFGVRLQGLAKFAFDNDKTYANNNILYTLDFLYRF